MDTIQRRPRSKRAPSANLQEVLLTVVAPEVNPAAHPAACRGSSATILQLALPFAAARSVLDPSESADLVVASGALSPRLVPAANPLPPTSTSLSLMS